MSSGVETPPREGAPGVAAGVGDPARRAAALGAVAVAAGALALAALVYALAFGVDDLIRLDREVRFPQIVGDWRFRDDASAAFARACEVGAVVGGAALLLGTLLLAGLRRAAFVAAVVGSGPLIGLAASWMLESTDPLGGEALRASQGAFPSGHALLALSLGLGLVAALPPRLRPLGGLAAVALASSVAAGVVALGWHYPSDVLGAFLLSLAGAAAVAAVARAVSGRWPPSPPGAGRRTALLVAGSALAAAAIGLVALAALPDESAGAFVRAHPPFVALTAGAAALAVACVAVFAHLLGGGPASRRGRPAG